MSLVAAEDQNFATHHGFDLEAIEKARAHNQRMIERAEKRGTPVKRLRGASTICQQTAKNLFLWSGRSWLRKGLEAWYTVLIETLWPKRRILEMYANIAEFGDGIYGAQAASVRFFNKDASRLTPSRGRAAGGGAAQSAPLQRRQARALRAAARRVDPAPGRSSRRRGLAAHARLTA